MLAPKGISVVKKASIFEMSQEFFVRQPLLSFCTSGVWLRQVSIFYELQEYLDNDNE